MGIESRPDFSRCLQTNNMDQNIRGQSVQKPAKDLLITSNLGGVLGVLNSNFLLVDVFGVDLLIWCLLISFNKIQDPGTAKGRNDKGFPDQGVLPGEELGGRGPEGSSQSRRGR